MPKLNQIIAIANGTKDRSQRAITEMHHKVQEEVLLSGISRRYRPKDEDGESLPPESKQVNYRVSDAIRDVTNTLTTLFDVVATQDSANRVAAADIAVDGNTILPQVPVATLLFIEKQLTDIHTIVDKLPTLDLAEEWSFSSEADCYVTPPHETARTKKIPKSFVRAEATKEHPAQVDVFNEDVIVGYWETVKFSGAVPESYKREIIGRVHKLQDAVKSAREEANSIEAGPSNIGADFFKYIFH